MHITHEMQIGVCRIIGKYLRRREAHGQTMLANYLSQLPDSKKQYWGKRIIEACSSDKQYGLRCIFGDVRDEMSGKGMEWYIPSTDPVAWDDKNKIYHTIEKALSGTRNGEQFLAHINDHLLVKKPKQISAKEIDECIAVLRELVAEQPI